MHDPVPTLSEPAKVALARLEMDWQRAYSRAGKGKGWYAFSLVKTWLRKRISETELQAWQVLEELLRAKLIELPAGGRLSPHEKWNARVELTEARTAVLMAASPSVDERLTLSMSQRKAWERALKGPLGNWTYEDQHALVKGLRQLASDLPQAYQLSPYVASARYLLGSSKLLDALPQELLRSFGIEQADFESAETWLLASVPEEPEGVLLIENAQSFTQACRVGCDQRLAIICTFGYGLSLGNALQDSGRMRLVGQGVANVNLTELLRLSNLTYWGDLDPEGMRIYLRLSRSLPRLNLSALLAPMIEAFGDGLTHPLDALTGKAGQRAGDDWQRGLDQECLEDHHLLELAGQALNPMTQEALLARLGG